MAIISFETNSWMVHIFGSWACLQTAVETNHPLIEVFFFLWMTGHLWCHASTVWASLLHRNWFHWLSDLGYQTQDIFCDINNILWPYIHMKEKKIKSFAGRTKLSIQKNTNVAYMCDCSHTRTVLVMYYHTCISQSSTHHLLLLQSAIFELRRCLSLWRNPIVLQTCWTLKTCLCSFLVRF